MRVTVSNVLAIENPTPEVTAWCKKNLTLPNPDYQKKMRMHLWTGNTPQKLALYEWHGNTLILPFGTLRRLSQIAPQDTVYESDFRAAETVLYGEPIPLYPYQTKAVRAVVGAKYGILQSAAGSGKTQMGVELIVEFKCKTLWLTHTLDLLKQSKDRAETYLDKDLMGTISEGQVNIGKGITFATVQTMSKLDLSQYKDMWDLIIVDECHRCSGTPTAMTQFYKVLNSLSARHKIGLSATVHRADGMIAATHALLGEIVYQVPDEDVADTVVKVGIFPVGTGIQISRECLDTDGTLMYARLINYLCENPFRNTVISQELINEQGHSCLILSDRLEHLELLMNCLPLDMRKQAAMISGKMTSKTGKAQREAAIEDMRTGKKKYLFATYSLAKEGLDIPCLERLFLTTPQKDYAVITQAVGRVARKCDGKADPIVYDFVDDMAYTVKAYKKRCTTYRKNGCYFIEEGGK